MGNSSDHQEQGRGSALGASGIVIDHPCVLYRGCGLLLPFLVSVLHCRALFAACVQVSNTQGSLNVL